MPADFKNYVSFLHNLRAALDTSGTVYCLSITLVRSGDFSVIKHGRASLIIVVQPSSYWYMQNFDIVNIEPIVDWLVSVICSIHKCLKLKTTRFNVMTYDLHGTWDAGDPYIGSIVLAHTNLTEIDQALSLLWRNNINPAKVNMGLGFYGRSMFTT